VTHNIFKTRPLWDEAAAQMAPISPQSVYRVKTVSARANSGHSKWRTEAMRSYNNPVLLWFTRGQGRITISGATRGFGAHNLIFLPAGTMYGFEAIAQTYGSIVHLPDAPHLDLPRQPKHMRFREAAQQNEMTAMIGALSTEIEQDRPSRERALDLHAGMMAVWVERQLSTMPECDMTPDASRRLTSAFTHLVESSFHTAHSVTYYAQRLAVSPAHLTRACKIACGKSASALLADRIHFEARRMLMETNAPVKKIAQMLGFASHAYFSRAFQKHTGSAPSAFRKAAHV
jgi:AraC-like DNA-binding protein